MQGMGLCYPVVRDLLCQFVRKTQIPITNDIARSRNLSALGSPVFGNAWNAWQPTRLITPCPRQTAASRSVSGLTTASRGDVRKFASKATICHIDIDAAEIGKRVRPQVSLHADVGAALEALLREVDPRRLLRLAGGNSPKPIRRYPLKYNWDGTVKPQYFLEQLFEIAGTDLIMSTGVGQHQMWAAQFYPFDSPRRWLTSGRTGCHGVRATGGHRSAGGFSG